LLIEPSTADAVIGLIDADVPAADRPVLAGMLRAHLAAFQALEALDLAAVEASTGFEVQWDE
jgi:hypothetical protein